MTDDARTPKTPPEDTVDVSALDQLPALYLPEPFAFANACELLDADGGKVPGCFLSVKCGKCRHAFKVPLLTAGPKSCPGCKRQFTTALLIAEVEDASIVRDFIAHVSHANFADDTDDGAGPDEDDDDTDTDDDDADDGAELDDDGEHVDGDGE